MKPRAKAESIERIKNLIETKGLDAHISAGKEVTIIGVVGDKSKLMDQNLEIFDDVDKIVSVTESYKLASYNNELIFQI
jgi:3-deoxy-7-phosphoheptulonate synthase